jgi:hypothetical protein
MSEFEKYSWRELINKLVAQHPHLRLAEVISVDRSKKTCDAVCVTTGMELLETRLMAIEAEITNSMVIYPKVGSVILVGIVDRSNVFVMLQAGETDGVEINGAAFSMVKGEELKAEITKLKQTVDAIVMALKSWVVVPSDGGGALKAEITSALIGKETGSFSDILNDKVRHG